ncbi:MAG: BTAD domain-containing putative transcriptional regulator, partial [Actinomycetota bacterium]
MGPPLRFGILGTLEVRSGDREVALESRKQRTLLAALLINIGAVVPTGRLAEILWGGHQPKDPAGAVHTHISRLRAALADPGGIPGRSVVMTRPSGYGLAVDADSVDAVRFEALVASSRKSSGSRAMADRLEEALGLWRGTPLVEFDHEDFSIEATRLEELHATAQERRADALLALGRHQEAANELTAAVTQHPYREKLRGQLMVALYGSGRQADALGAYRELRDLLAEELGVEPSVELNRLELAILQQRERLPWPAPEPEAEPDDAGNGRPLAADSERSDLPEAPTTFVGREDDLLRVETLLREKRIVVLTGTGGVGKSRLAVRVARRLSGEYRDGAELCDLVEAAGVDDVSDVVATKLGATAADGGGEVEDALLETLGAQQLLVILDNCEHVLAGAARLVDRIGRSCPGVDVLATSRQPLGIDGEQIWPVRPLPVEDPGGAAMDLFRDRAAAADPTFDLAGHRSTALEICRRLDGLPLAIELAAARLRSMTPSDIVQRLDRRFDLLAVDRRLAPPRQQSLQAVVDWSYALLPNATRRLFDRLAVFSGGFEMEAAERVCAGDGLPPGEVPARLAQLVDHSLVVSDRDGDHARYRLLETLRSFGRARLEESGELGKWQHRHAQHFASLAEEAATGLQGAAEAGWVQKIHTEFANLRSAQAWARNSESVELALRIPNLLRTYAYYRLRDEVFEWAARALELPGAPEAAAFNQARLAAGVGWMQRGDMDRAEDDARSILEGESDRTVILRALQLMAEVALYRGELEESDQWGAQMIELAGSVGSLYYESLGYLHRVFATAYQGRTEEALALQEEGWRAVNAARTPTLRAGFLFLEGEIRLDTDPEAAMPSLRRAIEVARSVDNRFIEGVARVTAASLEARHGHPDSALLAFRQIVEHWRASRDWVHMWTTLHNLLLLLQRIGVDEAAAVLLGAADSATTGTPAFGADARRLESAAISLRETQGQQQFAGHYA